MADLYARWSKRERDLLFVYPARQDGHLLHVALSGSLVGDTDKTLVEHLKERGYDITTLRFSIDRLRKEGGGDE